MLSLAPSDLRHSLSKLDLRSLGIPALVLMTLAMLVLPLPTVLLDMLFVTNITIALIVILVAIHTDKPLDFSAFPAVLLMTTMLRLSLNVASTRIILINGQEGSASAGKVIEAFGNFVIAGNYVVGFIVFSILLIINFMVVTKGAGRVSEVIARFTLDAMPGKQMAIDADLNSGVIDQDEARARRTEVAQESDFFGSMDGASKFVRGDAIAGLLILIINIVGGLIIGTAQHGMSFSEAGEIYVLLTIGDGLVAQIPSLILSLATAIVVTRVTTTETMTEQASNQLANPQALYVTGGILLLIGLVPQMPHAVFLSLSAFCIGTGYLLQRQTADTKIDDPTIVPTTDGSPSESSNEADIEWDDVDQVDLVGLEIGYGLIPLVNEESGGQLMSRVKGVRKKLSTELGFLVQPVRIRDNLDLDPDHYHIMVNGVVRGQGEIRVGRELAIDPGHVHGSIEGVNCKEPAFGLDAVWIEPAQRDTARTMGYTVVDAATAIATHLNNILRDASPELIGHDETQQLLDKISQKAPKLVEDLVPAKLTLGAVTRIIQNLLREGVPIRDMRTVLEVLAEESTRTQNPDELTGVVRPKLGRMIIQGLVDLNQELPVMTLEPQLEQLLHNVLQQSQSNEGLMIEPALAERLFSALRDSTREIEEQGLPAVLVVSPAIRSWLASVVRHRVPDLTTLSYTEIPDDQSVNVISTISVDENPQLR